MEGLSVKHSSIYELVVPKTLRLRATVTLLIRKEDCSSARCKLLVARFPSGYSSAIAATARQAVHPPRPLTNVPNTRFCLDLNAMSTTSLVHFIPPSTVYALGPLVPWSLVVFMPPLRHAKPVSDMLSAFSIADQPRSLWFRG